VVQFTDVYNFFHAHHAVDGNDRNGLRGWEVDGGDADDAGSTARTYIRCPCDATELGPTGYTITRMLTGAGEDRPWPWNWPDDEWAGIRELRRFVDRQFHEKIPKYSGSHASDAC
jgi:hypothetical protein